MTHPRLRPRPCVTIPTLDARTSAPSHRYVVDLTNPGTHSSPASLYRVVSCPQPVIEPTAATAQPPLAAPPDPPQALQSP